MIIEQLPVGLIAANAYVVIDEATLVAAVIDPGGDVDRILEVVREYGATVSVVINTHGHFDHMAGNAELLRATGAQLAAHRFDAPLLSLGGGAGLFGIEGVSSPAPDLFLDQGDAIELGESRLTCIYTPGHTPGGISLHSPADAALFTGDTLFASGIGRTDLPGGDYDTLMGSIRRLLALPGETLVYPGHGPATTIADERDGNPFLQ